LNNIYDHPIPPKGRGKKKKRKKEKMRPAPRERMTKKEHDKTKSQKPQISKQLEVAVAEQKPLQGVNQRQEKLANFLIDVAKYVFTGVIITSLFNDVSDKTILYVVGMGVVFVTLLLGLSLTNKGKEK
jgi:hypothetical protein